MKQVELKLSAAELVVLSNIIVMITRAAKRNPIDGKYYDPDGFFLECDKKQMAALRSIARKIGVK